ncbi:RNA polymerase sigma-70 factor, ECF subfamily [Amphibacillus marinus]|uniref:RNA polymerase sigma-70 factor, ECF subfamily n=1 Tax=Amphibacillus marinus TaxID=872970 RepID=A0A1H8KK98_9BACI|nr:RNA polymerase sigma factor [Amphibacillus marinus]SEN93342.1 RNA polymerase sigma-70 factor, ECF subfamily [Amphibacillus marinus]
MANKHPFDEIEKLYQEYYQYLCHFLMVLTRDGEVANDIIQELFSKILTNPSLISEVTHIKSWLVKATKNTLLDYYKKKRPELLSDENLIETLLIHNQTPELKVIVNAQINSILASLPSTDKAILLAKVYYGYDYQEIRELLHIPISTLKSKVFRMRKQIAKRR